MRGGQLGTPSSLVGMGALVLASALASALALAVVLSLTLAPARAAALTLVPTPTSPSGVSPAAVRHIQLGVLGDPQRFLSITGQESTVRHLIVGWGQGAGTGAPFADDFAQMGRVPMLGLNPGTAITPLQIAQGSGDAYLVALNAALAVWGKAIYIRPMGEMNGHWTAYSAYNQDGSSRGPTHSTAAFRKAFARIYLIVHGGVRVNAQLRRLGLPPVDGSLQENRLVKVIWNPQGYGSPDLPDNGAAAYYPGDRYVDVVGDDLYDIRGRAAWEAADALYKAHPDKPFSIPEWGLWGIDDPAFIERMAAFLVTHRRTILAAYYSDAPGSIWDLAGKPRSRAAYRKLISPLGERASNEPARA